MKTSLAPGSQVVADISTRPACRSDLDALGFNLVGFGCTTCIGNSGPLPADVSKAINDNDLVAAAVLSGNRNFEGRVNPDVRANYLASPPLVVAYALAGSMQIDLIEGAARHRQRRASRSTSRTSGRPRQEIQEFIRKHVTRELFKSATPTCSRATRTGRRSRSKPA